VYVHPIGAPHLIDPSRLVRSARRVFGETLEPLLGEVQPVAGANIRALTDGQQVEGFIAAWTPGHASHHVAFLDPLEGLAYTGDVAGVRLAGGAVLPPTPPPDIDLRLWEGSLELLERWQPRALALAHFGRVESPQEHIALLREALARHERWASAGVEEFAAALHQHLCARVPPAEVEDYEFIAMARQSPLGLRRWLEREQAAAGTARGD
jgi:glyoxylase-like metal-dependent hydrolase (beta-lactamase superfamily II)